MLSNAILHKLKTTGIGYDNFFNELQKNSDFSDLDLTLQLLEAQGLNIVEQNRRYYLDTALEAIDSTTFCIVDIEVNGMQERHQIIEIGAVKYRRGKIIDTFESLVQCNNINEFIEEITGISVEMTKNAPKLCDVMQEFRLFLGTSVFVAHDIRFDYKYVSKMMSRCLLEPLLNRKLCTIELAERIISSYKYGLGFLNDTLHLNSNAQHHRALSDAITTTYLLDYLIKKAPKHLKKAEDLIEYSKKAKRMKRIQVDPRDPELIQKEFDRKKEFKEKLENMRRKRAQERASKEKVEKE